jgi:isocitrate/isopropylmalate dehydrogenase
MAMILAVASLLQYAGEMGHEGAGDASEAVYAAVLDAVRDGVSTPDLGGHAGTGEFTDAVIGRVRSALGTG